MTPEENVFQDLFDIGTNEEIHLDLEVDGNMEWIATIRYDLRGGNFQKEVASDPNESPVVAVREALDHYAEENK